MRTSRDHGGTFDIDDIAATISTKILILSDTHGANLDYSFLPDVDVAIHCGDMTEGSKLDEFRTTLSTLETINAPLKLVIAGNHDFTLDTSAFEDMIRISNIQRSDLPNSAFGDFGEALQLLEGRGAVAAGIRYMHEGTHEFTLSTGASLTVCASPYTPSLSNWGFVYRPEDGHDWDIPPRHDIAVTHGPPHGILDRADNSRRAGCQNLFAAIARAQPRVHCFGHIHEGWGAKNVVWNEHIGESPNHFSSIDEEGSQVIETLTSLKPGRHYEQHVIDEKNAKSTALRSQGYIAATATSGAQKSTLFVNAAIESRDEHDQPQLPWIITIDLPKAPDKTDE